MQFNSFPRSTRPNRNMLLCLIIAALIHFAIIALLLLAVLVPVQPLEEQAKKSPQKQASVIIKQRTPTTKHIAISDEDHHATGPITLVGQEPIAQEETIITTISTEAKPPESKPLPEPTPQKEAPQETQKPEPPPLSKAPKKAHKRPAHSWHTYNKTEEQPRDKEPSAPKKPATTTPSLASIMQEYPYKTYQQEKHAKKKAAMGAAEAAEKFDKEIRSASIRNYIGAIGYAICFSLNRMHIRVSQNEMLSHLILNVSIDRQGNILSAQAALAKETTSAVGSSAVGSEFLSLLRDGIMQAAPFPPMPSSYRENKLNLQFFIQPQQYSMLEEFPEYATLQFSLISESPYARR